LELQEKFQRLFISECKKQRLWNTKPSYLNQIILEVNSLLLVIRVRMYIYLSSNNVHEYCCLKHFSGEHQVTIKKKAYAGKIIYQM
jgi:hypothetical protein